MRMSTTNLTTIEWGDVRRYADIQKVTVDHSVALFEEYKATTSVFGSTRRSRSAVVEMSYEMRLVEVVAYMQNLLRTHV